MDFPIEDRVPIHRRWAIWIVLGAAILVSVSWGIATSRSDMPSVRLDQLLIGRVERGAFVREIRAPGILVATGRRWITALAPGAVETIAGDPGLRTAPDTVLVHLTNPEVEAELLDAESQLGAVRARLRSQKAQVRNDLLSQEALVVAVRVLQRNAARTYEKKKLLFDRGGMVPEVDVIQSREVAAGEKTRLLLEQQRLDVLKETADDRIAGLEAEVARMASLVELSRSRVESLRQRAAINGVVSEVRVELGEWVTPGQVLALVVDPTKAKAELQVPQSQVNSIRVGQMAFVGTRQERVNGTVARIDPSVTDGSVTVEIELERMLASGRPNMTVNGTVVIERLDNAVFLQRPPHAVPDTSMMLFKVNEDSTQASRVRVSVGLLSASQIQVEGGLAQGDRVVVSDTSQWTEYGILKIVR